jgi:hypothetical protein
MPLQLKVFFGRSRFFNISTYGVKLEKPFNVEELAKGGLFNVHLRNLILLSSRM